MNLELVLRLEEKIDRLLGLKEGLEQECRQLREERALLLAERERVRGEVDRILAKLDRLDQESP